MKTALLEPRNKRFMLLSDADIPLYPATLTYLQIMQVKVIDSVWLRGVWSALLPGMEIAAVK